MAGFVNLRLFFKRAFDVTLGLVALIGLAIPSFVIAALIKATSRAPAFFRQPRPGKNSRLFVLYKFRTMTDQREENGNLLPDEKRLTSIGRFLRKLSLDELPELWNVLKGDMSIVGPRPLLKEYLARYTPEQARRHELKPGLTGWAQVNGRNAITWDEKFEYDLWYIDNWSLWLDIKIICMTIMKVLKGEGISQPGHATMEEFRGKNWTT